MSKCKSERNNSECAKGKDLEFDSNLAKLVTTLVVAAFNVFSVGFVLQKIWVWFIVPVFLCNTLTFTGALGLVFVLNFFEKIITGVGYNTEKKDTSVGVTVIFPWVVLAIGYLLHLVY